eukprot:3453476-Prymnesium_polylepis.2
MGSGRRSRAGLRPSAQGGGQASQTEPVGCSDSPGGPDAVHPQLEPSRANTVVVSAGGHLACLSTSASACMAGMSDAAWCAPCLLRRCLRARRAAAQRATFRKAIGIRMVSSRSRSCARLRAAVGSHSLAPASSRCCKSLMPTRTG